MAVVVFIGSYYCLLIVGLFADAFADQTSYPSKGCNCDNTEKWVQCPGCQATCDDPFPQSYSCPRICYKNGICVCNRGLVRSSDGNCVKLDECPHPKCAQGEKWSPCNAYCIEKTCVNLNSSFTCDEFPPTTTTARTPTNTTPNPYYYTPPEFYCSRPGKCTCANGLVRDIDGKKCIHPSQCKKCGANESLIQWPIPKPCEASCANPQWYQPCAFIANQTADCRCLYGYVRSANGTCILPEKCPQQATSTSTTQTTPTISPTTPTTCLYPSSTQQPCPSCEPSCGPSLPIVCPPKGIKCVEGGLYCACSTGFLRNGTSGSVGGLGECIPISKCPYSQLQ